MKYLIFSFAVSTATLFGCAHNHDHQHESANNHNHQPGENCDLHATDPHEEEADHQDEIIFPAEQAARTDFEVQAVKESNFTSVIHCSGEITASPDDQKFLSSPVSGIVVFSGKNPAEGMPVKAGETLFYISTRGLATGDAVVKARADYERAQILQADRIVSQKDVDAARAEFLRAEAEYQPLAAENENGVPVKAPQTGFLTGLTVTAGQYVDAGAPLAAVSENRRLRLTAEVPQRHFSDLNDITNAYFSTGGTDTTYSISELHGKRLSIGRSTSTGTSLIPVIFEFDNPGELVAALTEAQGVYYVYVQLDEEGYQRREVKIGDSNGREVAIIKGLQAGERVVTRGAVQVKMAAASGTIPHGHSHNH